MDELKLIPFTLIDPQDSKLYPKTSTSLSKNPLYQALLRLFLPKIRGTPTGAADPAAHNNNLKSQRSITGKRSSRPLSFDNINDDDDDVILKDKFNSSRQVHKILCTFDKKALYFAVDPTQQNIDGNIQESLESLAGEDEKIFKRFTVMTLPTQDLSKTAKNFKALSVDTVCDTLLRKGLSENEIYAYFSDIYKDQSDDRQEIFNYLYSFFLLQREFNDPAIESFSQLRQIVPDKISTVRKQTKDLKKALKYSKERKDFESTEEHKQEKPATDVRRNESVRQGKPLENSGFGTISSSKQIEIRPKNKQVSGMDNSFFPIPINFEDNGAKSPTSSSKMTPELNHDILGTSPKLGNKKKEKEEGEDEEKISSDKDVPKDKSSLDSNINPNVGGGRRARGRGARGRRNKDHENEDKMESEDTVPNVRDDLNKTTPPSHIQETSRSNHSVHHDDLSSEQMEKTKQAIISPDETFTRPESKIDFAAANIGGQKSQEVILPADSISVESGKRSIGSMAANLSSSRKSSPNLLKLIYKECKMNKELTMSEIDALYPNLSVTDRAKAESRLQIEQDIVKICEQDTNMETLHELLKTTFEGFSLQQRYSILQTLERSKPTFNFDQLVVQPLKTDSFASLTFIIKAQKQIWSSKKLIPDIVDKALRKNKTTGFTAHLELGLTHHHPNISTQEDNSNNNRTDTKIITGGELEIISDNIYNVFLRVISCLQKSLYDICRAKFDEVWEKYWFHHIYSDAIYQNILKESPYRNKKKMTEELIQSQQLFLKLLFFIEYKGWRLDDGLEFNRGEPRSLIKDSVFHLVQNMIQQNEQLIKRWENALSKSYFFEHHRFDLLDEFKFTKEDTIPSLAGKTSVYCANMRISHKLAYDKELALHTIDQRIAFHREAFGVNWMLIKKIIEDNWKGKYYIEYSKLWTQITTPTAKQFPGKDKTLKFLKGGDGYKYLLKFAKLELGKEILGPLDYYEKLTISEQQSNHSVDFSDPNRHMQGR